MIALLRCEQWVPYEEESRPRHVVPMPMLYEDAWYDRGLAYVRVVAGEGLAFGSLAIDLDCTSPPDNHWLSYEMDCYGSINEMLCIDDMTTFLLSEGIAPGQSFYMLMTYEATRDYWGEYDTETDYLVMGVVPQPLEKVCTEWEAFIGRDMMMRWLD